MPDPVPLGMEEHERSGGTGDEEGDQELTRAQVHARTLDATLAELRWTDADPIGRLRCRW